MFPISFRTMRRLAAFWLISGSFCCGELHGQTPAAKGSSGNSPTGAAAPSANASGGNSNAGRGSGGSMAGSSAGGTVGNSTTYRTGNRGQNYSGGNGYAGRAQWQSGGASNYYGAPGGYGGGGQYSTAAYSTANLETVFPGGVAPLPHWREVGTLPLPTTFRPNTDNVGVNLSSASTSVQATAASLAPIVIPADSGGSVGGRPTGPISLGFEPPRTLPDQVGQAIAKRLGKLPSIHFLGAFRVDIAGRTAYLRGRVASEHERDLAERVVLLEAGIDDVVNLMEVGSADSALPPPPAPATPAANR